MWSKITRIDANVIWSRSGVVLFVGRVQWSVARERYLDKKGRKYEI